MYRQQFACQQPLFSFQCLSHAHRLKTSSKRRFLDLVGHCPVLERHPHAVVLYAAIPAGRRVTALQVIQAHFNLVAARTLALELALASGRNLADNRQLAVLFSFSNDDRAQLTFPSPWVSVDFSSSRRSISCNSHCYTVSYLSLARILSNIDSCSLTRSLLGWMAVSILPKLARSQTLFVRM